MRHFIFLLILGLVIYFGWMLFPKKGKATVKRATRKHWFIPALILLALLAGLVSATVFRSINIV